MATLPRRLYRKRDGKMIAGVAAGLADYFDVDPTLVRLVFVIAAIINGIGVLVYVGMMFVVPQETSTSDSAVEGDESTMSDTAGSSSPESTHPWRHREQRHTWAGVILISLGLLFLAQNMGLLWWWNWRIFWPMVLIIAGTLLLSRRLRQ